MTHFDPRDPLSEYDENELVFHEGGAITRKQMLLAGGALAGAAAGGPLLFTKVASAMPMGKSVKLPYNAHTSVKGHLEFWHFWSSPLRRGAIHQAINQFRSVYKGISVSDLPVPFGDFYNKLDAAVVAQQGVPDVVISNRLTLWNDGPSTYIDLTPFNAKDKVSGKLYWPVNWQQANVKIKGKPHLYALPFETDIRVLWINRAQLVNGGISPNYVPKTWADLVSVADKTDDKSSGLKRMTFWPPDIGLDTAVWLNNGDWVNKKNYPTANSAANVATGEWFKYWADRYGGQPAVNALFATSNPGVDPFASQLLVLHVDQPTYQPFTLTQHGIQFHPANGKDPNLFPYWTVAYLPVAKKGDKPWSFSGGFSVSAPKNKHRSSANTAAAWEFIKFMSLVGQLTFEQFAGNIPTVIAQAHSPQVARQPNWSSFLAALKYQHRLVQNKYDPQYPGDVDATAQNHILDGSQSPKDALDAAQSQALANMKRKGGP